MTESPRRIMSQGRVDRQIRLPLRKAVEIGFRNMRVRFGRTLITAGGIVLGIAFLSFVWTTQTLHSGLLEYGSAQVKESMAVVGEEAQAQKTWLVTLSLLVSAVGITNAMLMAVTERYREIGTMKCLGALDSFVVKMFLIESSFQGLVGSTAGCIIGVLLGVVVTAARYGGEVFSAHFVGPILGYALIALVIGMALAIMSALYPAYVAAKMVPADALRSEI